jgi:pSer/pThr/pTyr-binding forkhead associated (FHA) protein
MRFTLGRERVTLGRSEEADIPIEDDLVSRFHSSILYVNYDRDNELPDCRMFDEKSTNGTFVNGVRIDAEGIWLSDRERIEIGHTVFGFFIRDEEELDLEVEAEAQGNLKESSS